MTKQRRNELEKVDRVMERMHAALENPNDPRHREAKRMSHKLATEFNVDAKVLLEMSSFWNDRVPTLPVAKGKERGR